MFRRNPSRRSNPIGRNGSPLKCNLCFSTEHFRYDCPYDKEVRDLLEKKRGGVQFSCFCLFVGCASSERNQKLQTLLEESKGYAILDCGCATTVCGEEWLGAYVSTLSDEDRFKIEIEHSTQMFTFGDGKTMTSMRKVKLPCWMGGVAGEITTDVVDCKIPLLLSRQSMKNIGMVLDFSMDTATVGSSNSRRVIQLKTTSSGHYALPISL